MSVMLSPDAAMARLAARWRRSAPSSSPEAAGDMEEDLGALLSLYLETACLWEGLTRAVLPPGCIYCLLFQFRSMETCE